MSNVRDMKIKLFSRSKRRRLRRSRNLAAVKDMRRLIHSAQENGSRYVDLECVCLGVSTNTFSFGARFFELTDDRFTVKRGNFGDKTLIW